MTDVASNKAVNSIQSFQEPTLVETMKKLSDFFYARTNGYLVLGLLALQFAFSGAILPYFQKQFDPELNRGLMDLSFGFSAERGYQIIESYGENGRAVYLLVESLIDVVYPIIYTLSFIMLISFLFKKNGWEKQRLAFLNVIPIGGLTFDLLENTGIIQMLRAFPERVDFWAAFASNNGLIKWFFAGITLLTVLSALGAWGVKALKNR
ncbi:hypothetical protein Emtol_1399 [Emticicia oligotrophica DSM 17448]|uniref:Uncharacterized protein n=2 Tax=Emticicia TaxID=312278 RepID=A0ABN4AK00_EMTOG|nr:hypothetical protein Emtol_1399 [Emticicia oligotrophica DSM 17448]